MLPVYRIFVSYSRADEKIIEPIVAILRATGEVTFRDKDSIPPGTRWRTALTDAIDGC
jgi:TIR domain